MKTLCLPYYSQLDNYNKPYSTCASTSLAMVLSYYGITPSNPHNQLEDELYGWMSARGFFTGNPFAMQQCAQAYGIRDDFTVHGSLESIHAAIDNDNPCIIHGYFTQSGHVIAVAGYDKHGLIVNDPFGEWFSTGYRTDLSGSKLHYSNDLIRRTCMTEGQFWVHRFSK